MTDVKIVDDLPEEALSGKVDELNKAQENSQRAGNTLDQIQELQQSVPQGEQTQKPFPTRAKGAEFEVDGRVMRMEYPLKPTEIPVKRILSEMALEGSSDIRTTAIMMQSRETEITAVLYVTKINGEAIITPTNLNEYLVVINKLGEQGIQAVHQMYIAHFPPLQQQEIKLLKKW